MNPALNAWLPKSVILLRDYDRHKFLSDLIAGIIVGLVALPLAMAFAIASGVTPQAGIYRAIVTGFLISALGGSKTQIGGPTGAFVVVVSGIIVEHGIEGLFTCTMMAGVLLVLLGITGMGTAVKYFPRPVIVGFTNGIAILIAGTQIRDLFGLRMDHVPGDFFHRMRAFGQAWNTLSWEATALSLISAGVMVLCLKYAKRVPGAIIVTFGATAAVVLLHLSVETIGTRFGGIAKGLPAFAVPRIRCAGAARATHEASGIRAPRRRGKYLLQHQRRLAARRRRVSGISHTREDRSVNRPRASPPELARSGASGKRHLKILSDFSPRDSLQRHGLFSTP